MTKSAMPLVDSSMLAPLVAISNIYFGFVISEYLLFSLLTVSNHDDDDVMVTSHDPQVFVLFDLVISCTIYCQDIASHININIFTITNKVEK